ncbi:FISUMP domain-containing protein [Elizabethkingia anophelis]|uniref:FISUMP domain-containing protein n=1 Tax=Elizabethkingia anophelis TaxID=1117645 RepID=UPI00137013C6|nr:FISUMP domain-containing protein [Elizabethkingia anophelis]MYY43886.1 hypothetical protein [Elizabethkingia anophelis]
MITPSTVMVTTLSPLKSGSSTQAGLKNSMAVVSGNPLNNGTKFRVIAYKASDGSYQSYQDYTIGQTSLPMTLDTGVAYNIVAYSYGTSALPAITPGETSNISRAQIAYDNINKDLMYVKQAYTPSSSNATLNLTLMHQLMQIITSVTTNIGALNSVQNAALTPNFSDGSFPLGTGVMTGRTTSALQSIVFNQNDFPAVVNTIVSAPSVLINSSTTGNTASFAADINIDGTTKTVTLANSFDITPGMRGNLNVRLSKCGAYTAPGVFKEFMCQNLGATVGIDPFSPEAGNHGGKYQWGSTGKVAYLNKTWISQATDQADPGILAGWNTIAASNGSWNAGTEVNPVKSTNDPCGTGYRIPTSTELNAVLTNNTLERIGSWANNSTNYGTAIYFRNATNGRTLMLPTAGFRYLQDGTLGNRGSDGNLWSSTEVVSTTAYSLGFYSNTIAVYNNSNRLGGESVRCIAE